SVRLRQRFWHPLCVAAMNTPADHACAQLFANILRDSLGGTTQASKVLIPRVGLSELWAEPLARLADASSRLYIHKGAIVRELIQRDSAIQVAGQNFDGVVVATNIPSAIRLLKALDTGDRSTEDP